MESNNSFFGRNGTLNSAMSVADSIAGMKSNSSTGRLGALGRLVGTVMSLFA